MFDALFRFFFELSPVVFSQGEFRFAASTGSYVAAAAVAVAAGADGRRLSQGPRPHAASASRWRRSASRSSPSSWSACSGRCWSCKAAVPQQNFLGVLLDDSRSMQIADVDGQPRSAFVKSEFGANDRGPAEGAVRALHGPHVPFLERGDAHDAGKRPDVRRIAVAPRRGAVGRAAGAGRPCRSPAW